MKRLMYIAFTMILFVAVYLIVRQTPLKVETVVITPADFEETFAAEGKIRSRTKQIIYSFATGEVENLNVKVGDIVKKNQIVTKLIWDSEVSVKSPIAGVVSKVFRESAGPILRGEPILEVSRLEDLEVVVEMQTQDAVRLSPKGEVRISNWGGEGELAGTIVQISRAGVVKTSALGVEEEKTEARIEFNKITPELKNKLGDTYHVDVEFIVSREKSVWSIPLGALFKSGEKWAIYTVQNGKAHLRQIDISKRNDRVVMVTSGVDQGDRVILFPGDKIQEGTKVTF
ncbi:MAG: efflux RND transporter periplasmic adaptor subunit [Bdellovibrionales bacterium]